MFANVDVPKPDRPSNGLALENVEVDVPQRVHDGVAHMIDF
jgi:hypothetical protein